MSETAVPDVSALTLAIGKSNGTDALMIISICGPNTIIHVLAPNAVRDGSARVR